VGVTQTKEAIMTKEATTLNLALYDDAEVHPIERLETGDEQLADEDKDRADYWCVFGHLKIGGVDGLVDCVDEQNAEVCASILETAIKLLEALQLAQRALNAAPRFRVDDTNSYKIAAKVDTAIAKATG
jgi:hypothetical protein